MKFKPYEEYKEVDLPWLDRMPGHWEELRIKDIINYNLNGFWGEDPKNDENDCLCIRVADFDMKKYSINIDENLTKRNIKLNPADKRFLKKGDILLEKSGGGEKQPVGRAIQYNHDDIAVCSNFISKVSINKLNVNNRYILYLLNNIWNTNNIMPYIKQTTGIQNLDDKSYFSSYVQFPPKEEQDKIVDFLDENLEKIDRFIELRERQIELFQEEKEVIINDAVTKGIDRTVEYKDSGIDWMGDIPKHWNIERVKNITELASRGVTPIYTEKRLTKVVNQATFSKGYWDISNVRYTEVSPVDCRGVLKPDDILLASTGGGVLGKVYYFTENDTYIADSHVTILRCNEKVISKYMYYHFLVKYDFINACLAQGATNQTEIQGGWLRSFKLPIPPLEEQKEIVAYIEKETSKIDRTIELYKSQIELIKEYRTSLIASAVTGEIDVRNF